MIFNFVFWLWNAIVYSINVVSLTQRRIKFVFRYIKCAESITFSKNEEPLCTVSMNRNNPEVKEILQPDLKHVVLNNLYTYKGIYTFLKTIEKIIMLVE